MNNTFFKFFISYFFIIIIFIFLAFYYIFVYDSYNLNSYSSNSVLSSFGFIWPLDNYYSISSYFGRRKTPTNGASSFHSGIDIPAPEGTPIHSIDGGKIIFASWGVGGGYTITTILNNYPDIKVSYCHLSPIMYVSKDDIVTKGQIIGSVGPKNVYGISNNPYKDANGNPTNGATTGCHLHLTIKVNNTPVDPLNYFFIE